MGKNTKSKAVEDDMAAKDAAKDELLLSTKLVKQGMSPITNLEFTDIDKNDSTENLYDFNKIQMMMNLPMLQSILF